MQSLAELNATIEKAFHEFDKDGNGTISKEELKSLIERFEGSTIADDELNDLFLELDKDNSNVIEYSEFYAWFTSKSSSNKRLKRIATLSKKLFHVDAFTAAWNGDIKTVKKFLDSSIDVNASDETLFGRKNSMLHYAAYEGHYYVCKLLINSGADKYASNTMRCTPFHYACQQNQDKIIKYFLNDDINSQNIFIPDLEGNNAINVAGEKCRDLLRNKFTFPENNLTILHNKKFESQKQIEIYLLIQLKEFECFDSINIEIFRKEKNGSWTSVLKRLYSYSDYYKKDKLHECESKVPIDDSTYQLSFGKKYYNLKFDAIPSVRYKCVAFINDFPPPSTTAPPDSDEEEFEKDNENGLDDTMGGNNVEIRKSDDVVYGEDEILCCKCVPVVVNIIKLIEPPDTQIIPPYKFTVVFEYTPCICGSSITHFIIEYRPISGTTYDVMMVKLDNNNLIEEKEKGESEEKTNERKSRKYSFTFISKSKRIYVRIKSCNSVGEGPVSEDFPKPIGFVASNRKSNYGGGGGGGKSGINTPASRKSNQSRESAHSTQSKASVHSHTSNKQAQQEAQSESKKNSKTFEAKTNESNLPNEVECEEANDTIPVGLEDAPANGTETDVEKTLILQEKTE